MVIVPAYAPLTVSTVVESSESSDEPVTAQPRRRPLEPQPSWVDRGPVCHKDWFKLKGVMHWRCRYW